MYISFLVKSFSFHLCYMKNLPIPNALFTQNRKRYVQEMKPNSIAIFNSNDEMPMNGDATYKFTQNSDLYWLSGIEQEDSMVVLYPDNPDEKHREVLVLVRPNEVKEKWDGKRLRANEAKQISGFETVIWLDNLQPLLQMWMHTAETVYLNTNENDRKGAFYKTRDYRFIDEMKERYPLHQYERSARILKKLRQIKTGEEVAVTQQAIDITEKAFRRLLKFVKPGVAEYEIEAEIVHEFLRNRATREAYSSIIASGDRARTLHYISNSEECKDGELILMDFGALYGGYAADLTRTIPVNGKFTERQKEVYNACLHLHNYCKTLLKPGITLNEYEQKVGEEATQTFIKIGLLNEDDVANEDKNNRAYRRYLYHGISHHLGIDVHDLGSKAVTLEAGMLVTVEPGIYIEEESMGVRIENNVWITEEGNIDLMKNIPITVEEIESLMQKK